MNYPLHSTKDAHGATIMCGGLLMLPEQVGRRADGSALFCIECAIYVAPEQGQREQVETAARGEGWEPRESSGIVVPGSLTGPTREALYWHHRIEAEPDHDKRLKLRNSLADVKGAELGGLIGADGLLTDEGRRLAAMIMAPPAVTASAADRRGALTKYGENDRPKPVTKPRKTREPPPMVCECGHGPREHTGLVWNTREKRDVPADVPCCGGSDNAPCGCERFRQAKPVKQGKLGKVAS